MVVLSVKPLFIILVVFLSLVLAIVLLLPPSPFSQTVLSSNLTLGTSDIWSVRRMVEWRPCKWWLQGHLSALPLENNGYIRVDCYGGLNQMRRDLCDGVGIARLLNATLVLPKFEVAAYWNESSGFADVYDVEYFIQQMNGFIKVVKELPPEIASKEPFRVDCSKRKGQFDYIETVLPSLLEHHYISITPAMSQRRDRYALYAKASLCQACYSALRLTRSLENKASELLEAIPKPFLSLHLRFEPDMVAYSQCEYSGLSPSSVKAIEAARGDRKPWTGELAHVWRKRGKCPLTPNETAFILQSLSIPTDTNIYLAAGDGLMEIEGLTSVYTNVVTKSSLLSDEDFTSMHGNTKAALDYYVSINSDSYVATYFGNMDKMVAAMRAFKGLYKTLFLSRRAFAEFTSQGFSGKDLMQALWKAHLDDYVMGRGSALPDCFCEFKL
ncbi:O-fucosyltransferase 13 isoform X1 [Quercus robur]|uniref:O-fucosyltransferase 13 isoform X1 n=3 Tax=Quercus robur TaxID=38942 RepID=UPI0021638BF4|nr:O-fucosyltransferase 13 isoform X1 [Quercus robur]XP_050245622.1 O-fucosyltransferase 13 isoform X1 [Quercus robur]XP_050245623.1 O-fucosyltransferase 13 isoform X1 [Quercus robur]XP_050245624.1 O-fucosyltransferase 13 isoform X1 [Quercus robur]